MGGRRRGAGRREVAARAATLLISCLPLAGCSPNARYQILSTIFDGVPDPNAPVAVPEEFGASGPAQQKNGRRPSGAQPPPGSIHKAYADKRCDGCHGKVQWVPKQEPQRYCGTCHTDLNRGINWVHGPVAYGVCLRCHVPHSSPWKHLARLEGDKLCTQCHQALGPSAAGTYHAALGEKACLACHHAHGGRDRFMLREGARVRGSASRPETPLPEGG